jgi:hypothetical protein
LQFKTYTMVELFAELDALETTADNRVGGSTEDERARIAALEEEIARRPADSVPAALWRARRLARAVLNRWRDELVEPLARAVQRDGRLFPS